MWLFHSKYIACLFFISKFKYEKEIYSCSKLISGSGNNSLQEYKDNLNNKLLPGKTVKVCLAFELKNDNPVTVKFDNANFDNIGQKIYNVK